MVPYQKGGNIGSEMPFDWAVSTVEPVNYTPIGLNYRPGHRGECFGQAESLKAGCRHGAAGPQ